MTEFDNGSEPQDPIRKERTTASGSHSRANERVSTKILGINKHVQEREGLPPEALCMSREVLEINADL